MSEQLMEYAEMVDRVLMHRDSVDWEDGGLDIDRAFEGNNGAMLVSITINEDGLCTATLVTESDDIYEMLEDDWSAQVSKASDYVAVVTTGWAAPVDDGKTAPSQHAERRRVRLTLVADHSDFASVMRMKDDPDNTIVSDSGAGTGALAMAMFSMLDRARRK